MPNCEVTNVSTTISSLAGIFDGYEFIPGPISVSIEQGIIQDIKSGDMIDGPNNISGKGRIISVPFHDAHTHAIFSGNRFFELGLKLEGKSYSEILEHGGGIKQTVDASRLASDEILLNTVNHRLDTMLLNGTTCVEIKTGYALNHDDEIRHLRILQEIKKNSNLNISITYGGAHIPPPDQKREDYITEIIERTLPIIASEDLANSTDVFCDKGAFNVEETRKIFKKSKELGIPVRVHAEELSYTGIGKIAAREFNALSADHLLLAQKDDFQVLDENDTVATFMPVAPIGLFSNAAPEGWQETDVEIALGSDFNPNNWIISMQTAIRMGVYRYRMTPNQAFKAATSGSHKSIFGTQMEKLKSGSPATFLVLQAKSLEEFSAKIGQNLVRNVFIDGKILIENNSIIA